VVCDLHGLEEVEDFNMIRYLSIAALAWGAFNVTGQVAVAQNIPAGTQIQVRTNETIDARDRIDGRVFTASVAEDVLGRDGQVLIPRGAPAELIVRRMGQNDLSVDLDSITVGQKRYSVDASASDRTRREGVGENRRTGEYVGGGALLGTLLGAMAGGGKGAAIGAIAGGAAGAGAQTMTRGNSVHVPAESVLSFRLERSLDVYPDRGYDRDGRHYHRFDDSNNQYGDRNYYDDRRRDQQ
jgi:hypothetical protein